MSANKKMNVSSKPSFVRSSEKALLAYKGTPFTITQVEASNNKYGLCWLIHARFERPALERIISLPATPKRDDTMKEIAEKLRCGPLVDITLCYRWKAYHLVPRKQWKRPPSLDTVLFLK